MPAIDFGWWSDVAQVRAALRINVLFLIGVALAPILYWAFRTTRWGLLIRTAGESSDAARAMGYSVLAIRLRATMVGGFLAGIGGSFLSRSAARRPLDRRCNRSASPPAIICSTPRPTS